MIVAPAEAALFRGLTVQMRGYLAAAGDRQVRPRGELIAPVGVLRRFEVLGLVLEPAPDKYARWGYSAAPTEDGRVLSDAAFELCHLDGSWRKDLDT